MKIIAKTFQNLEEVLAQEIRNLGGEDIVILNRGVQFEGDLRLLYKCNYMLRTALKLIVPILEREIHNEEQLYYAVKSIAWEEIFSLKQTFALTGTTNSDVFTHSKYVALKSKDAIVDRFREKYEKRPNVNVMTPHIGINIHIRKNTLTVSLDSSGSSLHMRGYREYPVDAPINEVLAAGLVHLSGWDKKSTFLDPMCGSGTLVIEAACIAANLPAQKESKLFCFKNWKDYDEDLWTEVKQEVADNVIPLESKFYASDKSMQSFRATESNALSAGVEDYIECKRIDFFRHLGEPDCTIMMNPPYDERLKVNNAGKFYREIGDKCKKSFPNSKLCIISGNLLALKNLGLKPSKKYNLLNGQIESGYYIYELYEGSRKNIDA